MTEVVSTKSPALTGSEVQAVSKEGRPGSPEPSADNEQRDLIKALSHSSSLPILVADTQQFDLRQASRMAKIALEQDPDFDKKLTELLKFGTISAPDQVIRVLAVLESVCPQPRLLGHVLGLNHLEGRIRSKLTLMVGRLTQNPKWLRQHLQDENPRVRANAIEGLWDVKAEGLEDLLRDALGDPNHRVVANAALALYKLGDSSIIAVFHALLRHEDVMFRRAALWAISQTRDPRFERDVNLRALAAEAEELATAQKVASELEASRALSRFAAKLSVDVLEDRLSATGARHIRLACISRFAGRWLGKKDCSAANFIAIEGGKQIEDYRFRWVESVEPLNAVVVLPNTWNGKAEMLRPALRNTNELESYAFLPFQIAATSNRRNEQDEKIEVKFESGASVSDHYLERRNQAAKTLEQAVVIGLEALGTKQGRRHLFVIIDPSVGETAFFPEVAADLYGNTTINVIVWAQAKTGITEPLRKLAKDTAGRFAAAETMDDFARTMIAVRAEHFGACELSWNRQAIRDGDDVQIVCRGDFGYGEALIKTH